MNFTKYFIGHTRDGTFFAGPPGSCDKNPSARMAAYFAQSGRCYVTGLPLGYGRGQLHHRKPRSMGGGNEAANLVALHVDVHKLVHERDAAMAAQLARKYIKTDAQLRLLNQLRYEAGRKTLVKAGPWKTSPKAA